MGFLAWQALADTAQLSEELGEVWHMVSGKHTLAQVFTSSWLQKWQLCINEWPQHTHGQCSTVPCADVERTLHISCK